jgi:PilZ domain-containing protein/GAF domain-containing protein
VEKLCAELAAIFDVRRDEVALLRLQGTLLKFVFPPELQSLGAIPLSSSAVAARTATTRKAELFNSFVKVKHNSVFETVKLGSEQSASAPQARVIQKLMSAPIVDGGGRVLGVIQVSRKGAILAAAGPDFTPADLRDLEAAARMVPGLGILPSGAEAPKAAAPRMEDRRAFPRWPVRLSVQYGSAPDFDFGESTDISEGGIGFTGRRMYAAGAEIEVRFVFDLPGAKWFQSKALVRRAEKGALGVEFVGMAPSERVRLREALRAYAAQRTA